MAPLLRRGEQPGFVVVDMSDVGPITPLNWSPDEALPTMAAQGRTPLLLSEGVHWLLQAPEALQRTGAS